MSEHQSGINPGFVTKHTLSLNGLDQDNATSIARDLRELPGMDRVKILEARQMLIVSYDASHHSIDDIIAIVEKHRISIKDNWWSRIKLGWQRQTDQNLKDNAKHEPHCCNKIPHR
jgi:cation transport ATPase